MNRKLVLVAIIVAVLSPMLVNQAFAHEIQPFAPINYAVPPVLPYLSWGNFNSPPLTTSSFINPVEGWTSINIFLGSPPGSFAMSWVSTGWKIFNVSAPAQSGSVTADAWLNYTITGRAGIKAFLFVYDWTPPSSSSGTVGTFQWWTEVEFNAVPGNWESSFDLNVNPNDKSNLGNPFFWNPGDWYQGLMLLFATTGTTASSFVTVAPPLTPPLPQPPLPVPPTFIGGKFDDIQFITYISSNGNDFLPDPSPSIVSTPVLGPVGTQVSVNGTGFQPGEPVNLYFADTLVASTIADPNGSFFDVFVDVPANATLGTHVITATGATNDTANSFFDVCTLVTPLVGDINGDGKVDMRDVALVARNFGQTDPNLIDPPAPATRTLYASMTLLAAIIPLALFRRRQKKMKLEKQR